MWEDICEMIFIRWYWQYDFQMISTMWFVRWYWQYDFQMIMTIWFVKWCWQYDLSDDVDNIICQMMLTIWFVWWYWQYDLSDDVDNMRKLKRDVISQANDFLDDIDHDCKYYFTVMWCIQDHAQCTLHMWPSCVVCLVSSWLLLCLKEADKILAIENQKLKDSQIICFLLWIL